MSVVLVALFSNRRLHSTRARVVAADTPCSVCAHTRGTPLYSLVRGHRTTQSQGITAIDGDLTINGCEEAGSCEDLSVFDSIQVVVGEVDIKDNGAGESHAH